MFSNEKIYLFKSAHFILPKENNFSMMGEELSLYFSLSVVQIFTFMRTIFQDYHFFGEKFSKFALFGCKSQKFANLGVNI